MNDNTKSLTIIEMLATLYPDHITELQIRAKNVLRRENLDALVIHSGKPLTIFLDDQQYPFQCNPHFKHWLPLTNVANCWLYINGENKPKLIFHQPVDFWHAVEPLPDAFWCDFFDIEIIHHASSVDQFLPYDKSRIAYIGEHLEVANILGFELMNPEPVLNYLHFHRAYKTAYEQACIRQANSIAMTGHKAAHQAFIELGSEFDIQQAYLQITKQQEIQTPYRNIIALNEHAAILHYTELAQQKPNNYYSFLIDAGATFNGYGADITRTYALTNDTADSKYFNKLIQQVNQLALYLADYAKPGLSYFDLHLEAYKGIAKVLCDNQLLNCDVNTAIEKGIVSTFFPHGTGHHLGLQTHDVGGFMADERGTLITPEAPHQFLRTTRVIEANQVLTIEPGLYFIPSLLSALKSSEHKQYVNWTKVDSCMVFGGIRIEDNIIVHQGYNENITRLYE